MNQLFYGSMCLTDIVEHAKNGHSAFMKGKNGKVYFSVNVWQNSEPDKFGNSLSIQLNPSIDKKEVDGKPFIGNCKKSDMTPKPVSTSEVEDIAKDVDDLPF